jgi:hypothetical protein
MAHLFSRDEPFYFEVSMIDEAKEKEKARVREAVRAYRKKAKQAKEELEKNTPECSEYKLDDERQIEIDCCVKSALENIRIELPDHKFQTMDEYVITLVVTVVACLKRDDERPGWVVKVKNPNGLLAGGYFIEAAAAEAVKYSYERGKRLLDSPTFASEYIDALKLVVRKLKKQQDSELMDIVRAGIAGTYKPKPRKHKPEPEPVPVNTQYSRLTLTPLPHEAANEEEQMDAIRNGSDPKILKLNEQQRMESMVDPATRKFLRGY